MRMFRSGFESRIASSLDAKGVKFRYEETVLKYRTKIRKGLCDTCGEEKHVYQRRTYTPDFELLSSGIFVEAKGYFKSTDRSKMKAIRTCNPSVTIVMLFQGKDTTQRGKEYAAWCDKNGFDYDFGTDIPTRWL